MRNVDTNTVSPDVLQNLINAGNNAEQSGGDSTAVSAPLDLALTSTQGVDTDYRFAENFAFYKWFYRKYLLKIPAGLKLKICLF